MRQYQRFVVIHDSYGCRVFVFVNYRQFVVVFLLEGPLAHGRKVYQKVSHLTAGSRVVPKETTKCVVEYIIIPFGRGTHDFFVLDIKKISGADGDPFERVFFCSLVEQVSDRHFVVGDGREQPAHESKHPALEACALGIGSVRIGQTVGAHQDKSTALGHGLCELLDGLADPIALAEHSLEGQVVPEAAVVQKKKRVMEVLEIHETMNKKI